MCEYSLYRNSAHSPTKTEIFWIDLCPHTEEKNQKFQYCYYVVYSFISGVASHIK